MLQTVCDLDLKRRSYGHLKTHCAKVRKFRTLKSKVRKILSKVRNFFLKCENAPSFKNGLRNSQFYCKMIFQTSKWLQNDFQVSKWAAKMFQFFHGLQKCFSFPFGCKTWPPSYKMMFKNTLQSQGKLQKCQ